MLVAHEALQAKQVSPRKPLVGEEKCNSGTKSLIFSPGRMQGVDRSFRAPQLKECAFTVTEQLR
jgi:hypothetical protein